MGRGIASASSLQITSHNFNIIVHLPTSKSELSVAILTNLKLSAGPACTGLHTTSHADFDALTVRANQYPRGMRANEPVAVKTVPMAPTWRNSVTDLNRHNNTLTSTSTYTNSKHASACQHQRSGHSKIPLYLHARNGGQRIRDEGMTNLVVSTNAYATWQITHDKSIATKLGNTERAASPPLPRYYLWATGENTICRPNTQGSGTHKPNRMHKYNASHAQFHIIHVILYRGLTNDNKPHGCG